MSERRDYTWVNLSSRKQGWIKVVVEDDLI
jgi:hypothetical protein